jgi:putative transcriptional regulator
MSSPAERARPRRGALLVATPPLGDPNFDRTVVFLLEHNDYGSIGVVLNRPTPLGAIDSLAEQDIGTDTLAWAPLVAEPARWFDGGPVGLDSLIALAEGRGDASDGWGPITTTLGSVDLGRPPDDLAVELGRVRIFRGYAGWSPGQLDAELAAGAWMVFDAADDDVFTDAPDQLWRAVVRRQGGRLAWVADAPDDLASN